MEKMNIERRIASLESRIATTDASLKLVIVKHGETEADAMKRSGYLPDTANMMCVVFVSPTDARL